MPKLSQPGEGIASTRIYPELLAVAVPAGGECAVRLMPHTTLATARLRFLFLAAKIWRHAGRVA